MEMGVLDVHFAHAAGDAAKIVAALDALLPRQVMIAQDISRAYDDVISDLHHLRAPLFSLVNNLNHILSWTSTSYSNFSKPLQVHISQLVSQLLTFWEIWGRYLLEREGFSSFHDDARAGRLFDFFALAATLRTPLYDLLVERRLELDFRAQLSRRQKDTDQMAA